MKEDLLTAINLFGLTVTEDNWDSDGGTIKVTTEILPNYKPLELYKEDELDTHLDFLRMYMFQIGGSLKARELVYVLELNKDEDEN
jgi:hypothetical protein